METSDMIAYYIFVLFCFVVVFSFKSYKLLL